MLFTHLLRVALITWGRLKSSGSISARYFIQLSGVVKPDLANLQIK